MEHFCIMNKNQAIQIFNLTKQYPDDLSVLKNINLVVDKGDFVGLLGPNGSGKSTLLRILATLVKKNAGRVYIYGFDLDKQPRKIKSLLGYVPQEFNCSVAEPLWQIIINQGGYHGLPKLKVMELAEYYLKKVSLWEKRKVAAGLLSGGMKRRLMLVRALITQPKLLILDEPTVGIDVENRKTVWDILKKVNDSGTTIILASHAMEEVKMLCKSIAQFSHGKILVTSNV